MKSSKIALLALCPLTTGTLFSISQKMEKFRAHLAPLIIPDAQTNLPARLLEAAQRPACPADFMNASGYNPVNSFQSFAQLLKLLK